MIDVPMDTKEYEYSKIDANHPKEIIELIKTNENCQDEPSSNISYLQLFKFSTTCEKVLLIIALVLSSLSGLCTSVFSVIVGKGFDGILTYALALSSATDENEKSKALEAFMGKMNIFAIVGISAATFTAGTFYLGLTMSNYTAIRQIFKIRQLYLHGILNQDISWHDQNSTGEFAVRFSEDLRKMQDGMGDKLCEFMYAISISFTGIIISLLYGWELTLICLIPFPISLVVLGFIGKLSAKFSTGESQMNGEAGSVVEEALSYIKTVVAFDGQTKEVNKYNTLTLAAMRFNIKRIFLTALGEGIINFALYAGNALALWYGVMLVLKEREGNGNYTVESIITIFLSAANAGYHVKTCIPYIELFNLATGAAHPIFYVIDNECCINKSYEIGAKLSNIKGKITFSNVNFTYPARNTVPILKDLDLSIKPKETVALVGSSGCGKSTIIQLIQRFYDPSFGTIYVDDLNIKTLNLHSLRSHIGVVGQEPILFDLSISENIKLGNLNASQSNVEEAAKKSNAHSFITLLPNGYDTVIGERGTQLSGGQKQRIAIARALVRNPAILLLDEATSALDSKSESMVQEALDMAAENCTTVIVAHRLSTVRKADRIIVLDNGKVIEEGSHDDLILMQGFYHKLVLTQLSKIDFEEIPKELDAVSDLNLYSNAKESVDKDVVLGSDESLESSYKELYQLLKLSRSYTFLAILGIICSIVSSFNCFIYGYIYANAMAILSETDNDYIVKQARFYASVFVIIGIVLGILSFFEKFLIGISGENFTMKLKTTMFKQILNQDMEWFDRSENGVGSICARLSNDASSIQGALGLRIVVIINSVTIIITCIIVGLYFSWKLFLIGISYTPILVISMFSEQRLLAKENELYIKFLEQSTKLAVEAISNIRTVASLCIETLFTKQCENLMSSYKKATLKNVHRRGFASGIAKGVYPIAYVVILYGGSMLLKNNQIDISSILIIAEVVIFSVWSATFSLAFLPNVTKGLQAAKQIYKLLNTVPKIKNEKDNQKLVEGNIKYDNVSFSYPTRPNVKILKDFNLHVFKGKTVALVGPSGCGKSTIVQLLERFYDATSGKIEFGNDNIAKVNLSSLRSRLGIVMQEPNLFSATIAENIAYGNNKVVSSKQEIIEAAQDANIHAFVTSLPLGYDTKLGEKATQLSGGQKQRISIARALIRNPEVLLLDEATSALDAENEKIVQEALNNAKKERTCIVIAHRLKTIIDADLIVVVNEGGIAELGTHNELMSKKTIYYRLYVNQHSS